MQARRTARVCERRPQRDELRSFSVHHELRVPGDPAGVGARVDVPGLEGGDLGHVQHVADVQPVPGDLDAAEAVDREVAERVRRSGCWSKQRGRHDEENGEPFHRSSRLATGAQRIENCGFRRSARVSQARFAAAWPRQPSIIPRWKNLSASSVPSLRARFE